MGQLIKLPIAEGDKPSRKVKNVLRKNKKNKSNADGKIVFFTGVRYERIGSDNDCAQASAPKSPFTLR